MKRASPTGSPKTGSPTRETKLLPTYSSDDDGDDIKIKKKRVTNMMRDILTEAEKMKDELTK